MRRELKTHVNHKIDRILPRRVAIRIEETEGVVGTAVYCKTNFGNMVVHGWRSLGLAHDALLVAVADIELVEVSCERLQAGGFNLDSVVDVTAGVCTALAVHLCEILCLRDLVVHTHRGSRDSEVGTMTVQGYCAADSGVVVDIFVLRGYAGPKNHRVGVWITRGHAVGEVQLGRRELVRSVTLVDLVESDTKTRVVFGRGTVVEVASPACRNTRGQREHSERGGDHVC